MKSFVIVEPPIDRFINLEEAKMHLKLDENCTTEDDYIYGLIEAAHEIAEKEMDLFIGTQTINIMMDNICHYLIEISKSPIISIEAINYKDAEGEYQIFDPINYEVDIVSNPARIWFKNLPTLSNDYLNNIQIVMKVGMTTIPYTIKSAMLLIIGHLFENRQDVITGTQVNQLPQGAISLFNKFKNYG